MKQTFLFLFSLLTIFATYSQADNDPVFDPSHKALRTGVEYFLIPVLGGGPGGGLTLSAIRNKTCSLDVAEARETYDHGIPVTFHPVNLKKGASGRLIRESTDLNIKFSGGKTCGQSTFWKLDKYDKSRKRQFVTVGGVEGKNNDGSSLFQIVVEKDDYKFVHCSKVCTSCKVECKNVGGFVEKGRTLLALSDEPMTYIFEEVFKGV